MWRQVAANWWHNDETGFKIRKLGDKLYRTFFPSGIGIGYVDERAGEDVLEAAQRCADWQAQPENKQAIVQRMKETYPVYAELTEAEFCEVNTFEEWSVDLKRMLADPIDRDEKRSPKK